VHRRIDDTELLGLLGQVLDRTDAVPPQAVAAARAADWATLDAELAELTFDSLLDEREVALRDEADDVRSLTFTAGDRTVDVDLTPGELVGRVVPAADLPVEVVQAGGRRRVGLDDLGRFRAPVDPGPLRLELGTPERATTTPWITR
jgi:hypothetical protein